jgi:DNA-binding LytR/AlgR family response regulator
MIKAIAIDDESIATKVIENFAKEIEFLKLEKTFNRSKEGLRYLEKFPSDLIFLDIDMPELNGIDLYKSLKQDTMVIFITSRADYAVEGFNLNAVDYLLKPFSFDRFKQAVTKANQLLQLQTQGNLNNDQKHLFIRADFSLVKVPVASIIYVEGLDDYLKIHLDNQKHLVVRMTMKNLLEKLPAREFVRIHRSYIVANKYVTKIKGKFVFIHGKELPIGATYEEQALAKLTTQS